MSKEKALKIFRSHKGIMRSSTAIATGIHPRTLKELVESGELEKVSKGLYRMTELAPPG